MRRSKQTGLQRYSTPQLLAEGLADLFVRAAADAIAERGAFFVALSGGTTPKAAYMLLGQEPRGSAIEWPHVFVYFGDERCVPPDNERSNFKMANDAFLRNVGLQENNVHRMRGEDDPAAAALAYSRVLIQMMGDVPRFDLTLLGMGADGHTASLFPGEDPRTDEERLVRAPFVAKFNEYRLTMTPKVLNNARRVAIATEGAAKAQVLHAVLEGPFEPAVHPIQIVAPHDGGLVWLVDEAAATFLT